MAKRKPVFNVKRPILTLFNRSHIAKFAIEKIKAKTVNITICISISFIAIFS